MSPLLAAAVSRALHCLGVLVRDRLKNTRPFAAFCFWYAAVTGAGAAREDAEAALHALPERHYATGDPSEWRLIHIGNGLSQIAAAYRGIYPFKGTPEAAVGDSLDVTIEGSVVTSFRRQGAQDG
jgi:hypothetical protein